MWQPKSVHYAWMNVQQVKSGWSGELKASSQTKASFVTKANESILTFYKGTIV